MGRHSTQLLVHERYCQDIKHTANIIPKPYKLIMAPKSMTNVPQGVVLYDLACDVQTNTIFIYSLSYQVITGNIVPKETNIAV